MQITFRTEIEKLIYEKLVRTGSAVIPEFGLLFLREESAGIDFVSSTIVPPDRRIEFLQAMELEDYALSFSLHRQEGIPFEEAEARIGKYQEKLLETLSRDGSYEVVPIGTFSLSGDLIEFQQSKGFLPGISTGCKGLEIKPIDRYTEQSEAGEKQTVKPSNSQTVKRSNSQTPTPKHAKEEAAVIPGSERRSERKKRRVPWTAIGIPLLMLLVAALWYRIVIYPDLDEPVFIPVTYDEQRLNVKPEQPESTFSEISDATRQAPEDDGVLQETGDGEVANPGEDPGRLSAEEPSADQQEDMDRAQEETRNCVIIVGAFGNERNADKMYDRVVSEGFDPFTDQKGQLSRVGVLSNCDRAELLTTLRICRREIEPSSWILNLE